MALNPSSKDQQKSQPAKASSGGDKSARPSAPPAVNPSGPQNADPKQIGKYEITKKLGSGGMGAVYLATDTQLRRQVALKVLPKEKAENPQLVRRFQAEAQSAANLKHENIVTVYEAGHSDGYLYMALEFVDGIDTAELILRRGVVPFKRSVEIIKQVLKALDHAFSKSIVHRDIKPANLMIRRDGVVKLTDLGLARSREDPVESGITRAGTTVGTIDYMAPEQARDSKSADVRSDIYSLGCTWYFLLTGKAPFPEGSLTNKLRAHWETPFPDPRLLNPAVPEGVVAVMRRMTEKDPRSRYQTPAEALADLDQSNSSRSMSPDLALTDLAKQEAESTEIDVSKKGRSTSPVIAGEPPPPSSKAKKSKTTDIHEPTPQRDNRWLVYGAVAVCAVAVVAGLGWMVKSYSHVFDSPRTTEGGMTLSAQKEFQRTVEPQPGGEKSHVTQDPASANPSQNPAKQDPEPDSKNSTAKANSKSGDPKSSGTGGPAANPAPVDVAGVLTTPAWVRDPRTIASEKIIKVRANPRDAGDMPTLHAALASIAAATDDESLKNATVVELDGPGPFLCRPCDLLSRGRVVVRARGENGGSAIQPLVVLLPTEAGTAPPALIRCEGTQFELRGIHLALAANAFTSPLDALISMRDGNLFIQRCTITVPSSFGSSAVAGRTGESGSASLSAVRVLEMPDELVTRPNRTPSRTLIDDCVLRGPRLTVVSTDSPYADVVLRNTFAWSGMAPALRLQAPSVGSPSRSRLVASLFRSTLISQKCGIELTRPLADASASLKHPIAIGISDSLIAAPKGSDHPTLCSLPGWSRSNAKAACGELLTWQSIRSMYLGWNRLIDSPAEGVPVATTFNEWQVLFEPQPPARKPFGEPNQFQKPAWPTTLPAELAALDPASLSAPSPPIEKPAAGGWPGSPPREIAVPDLASLLASARDLVPRPAFPDLLVSDQPDTYPLHVNLMRDDLGEVLGKMKLRSGMTIIASGSDKHLCTPFVIDGVYLRIRFQQTDGPQLVLIPRAPEFTPKGSDDAFISVRNGSLELINAVFDAPADEKKVIPKWFVQGLNSDLVLRNCRISGPMAGTRNLGTVQWLRTGYGSPTRPPEHPKDTEGLLVVQDSWLSGGGTVIQADLPRRAAFVRNSMLVARDTVFDLGVGGTGPSSTEPGKDPTLDLERCTLSAGGRIFQFAGPTFPLRAFADRCVYAPPLKVPGATNPPVLLACSAPTLDQKQVHWWEQYCGYAPELTRFVQLGTADTAKPEANGTASSHFQSEWEQRWGQLFVNSPLTSSDGVSVVGRLPDPRKITPANFVLGPCQALDWAPYKKPIGADLQTMKLPEGRPLKSSSSGSGNTPSPKPPLERTPPPKKNPPKAPGGF